MKGVRSKGPIDPEIRFGTFEKVGWIGGYVDCCRSPSARLFLVDLHCLLYDQEFLQTS